LVLSPLWRFQNLIPRDLYVNIHACFPQVCMCGRMPYAVCRMPYA
jgi:hypothetical protein